MIPYIFPKHISLTIFLASKLHQRREACNGKLKHIFLSIARAIVLARLVPTPDMRSPNPVISNFYLFYLPSTMLPKTK